MSILCINDDNFRFYCKGGKEAEGKSFGWEGRKGPFGSIIKPLRADYPLIPELEWKNRIRAKQGRTLSGFAKSEGIKVKDQNGLGYCWVYGSTECVELIRAVQGEPYFNLSPESVGGPATNWRNEGGYAEEAANQLQAGGACTVDYMDKPNSLSPKKWKEGWQDNALNHRIDNEWWDVPNYASLITLLLHDFPCAVGMNWWGHLVMFCDAVVLGKGGRLLVPFEGGLYTLKDQVPWSKIDLYTLEPNVLSKLTVVSQNEWDAGEVGVLFRNSWGQWPEDGDDGWATLSRSKAQPDGAFCPRVATAM